MTALLFLCTRQSVRYCRHTIKYNQRNSKNENIVGCARTYIQGVKKKKTTDWKPVQLKEVPEIAVSSKVGTLELMDQEQLQC